MKPPMSWGTLTEKTSGINPEDKTGVGTLKAVRFCKHHQMHHRSSIVVALDFVSTVECGWHTATACLPYKFCPDTRRIVHNEEETPSSSLMLIEHGDWQLSVISHSSIDVMIGARAHSRRWVESSGSTEQLTQASNSAAPLNKVPSRFAYFYCVCQN